MGADESLALLPVPYLVLERVPGRTLAEFELPPDATPHVWREVGRELARLHEGVAPDGATAGLETEGLPNPRPLMPELEAGGHVGRDEARWLSAWLERLAPAANAPVKPRFLHGDLQTTNLMVETACDRPVYRALFDWGSCGWGDPAHDLAGIPLRAVPFMLEGHRELAPLPSDDTAEARVLWRHLQIALWLARRGPQPGTSWAERSLGMLLEILYFLGNPANARWRALVE